MPNTIIAESFRHDSNLHIKVGKEQKEYVVERLTFKQAGPVVRYIIDVIKSDVEGMLRMLAIRTQNNEIGTLQEGHIGYVSELVDKVLIEQGIEVVKEGLKLISNNVFTDNIIDDMQYSEAVGILMYLINNNFESKKNLWNSLRATFLSDQNSNG